MKRLMALAMALCLVLCIQNALPHEGFVLVLTPCE